MVYTARLYSADLVYFNYIAIIHELCILLTVYRYSIVPIFLVSNKTGRNLDLVKAFLGLLPSQPRHSDDLVLKPADFMVCMV